MVDTLSAERNPQLDDRCRAVLVRDTIVALVALDVPAGRIWGLLSQTAQSFQCRPLTTETLSFELAAGWLKLIADDVGTPAVSRSNYAGDKLVDEEDEQSKSRCLVPDKATRISILRQQLRR